MSFKPDFAALTDVAQVVYLDLRGGGRSDDDPDGRYSLEGWADDIVAFCEVLGIDKPIVLGNSAGGMVARSTALIWRWRSTAWAASGTGWITSRRCAGSPAPRSSSPVRTIR
jgi:proline iminopeptidase